MPENPNDAPVTNFPPTGIADPWAVEPFAPPAAVKPIPVDESAVAVYRTRDELRDALRPLPKQAVVIVALRAAKRVDVLVTFRQLATEAVAAGLDIGPYRLAVDDECAAARAAECAARATDDAPAIHAADALICAAGDDSDDGDFTWKATFVDLTRVQKLAAAELDPPLFGWDDPRLGPLWPDGPPEWHKKVEQEVRGLKAKLAARPDPFAPPIPAGTLAQLADHRLLTEMQNRGELEPHAGNYVAALDEAVVGSGPDAAVLLAQVSEKYQVPKARIAVLYVY